MWKNLTTACVAGILSTPVFAQSSEWQFQGSLYLFAAETDLTVGDVEGTLSFSDALDNLDFAGMAAFRATNNKWTFIGDLMYFNLGFENDTSRPLFSRVDTDQKNTILSGYALYRVYETQTAVLDLGGGFRYFNTDTELTLRSDVIDNRRVSTDDNWTDPILAAQANFKLSDTWGLMLAADYGSFIDDRTTYSVTATLDYAFNENWIGRIGYRYLNVEDEDGDVDFRFEQSGPILGVSYRF